MLLARKLGRELRQQKGQTFAVIAVSGLGVLLYVASAGGYRDLRDSYADTRARLALADLHVDVDRISEGEVHDIARIHGVTRAEARVVTALPIRIGERDARVELRVLSTPRALDRVLVLSGRLPRGPGEVLLEKHLALHHGLEPGDTVELDAPGTARTLRVSGVAVSAEYLWVARDETDVFATPDAFGVGWMDRAGLRALASDVLRAAPDAALPGLEVAASEAAGNQLLLDRAPSAHVMERVRSQLGSDRVLAATPADELVGVRLLQLDVDGYRGMAAFFPIFFLAVAAFIVASILSRLVASQRALLATLLALGVSRERVLAHYLAYALVLAGIGSVLGAALGLVASAEMTHEYALELGIPFVTTRLHWDLALQGIGLGALTALLAGSIPAYRASRLAPAEGMRPPRPSALPIAKALRRLPLPLWLRLAVRDVLGRPLRSAGTVLGVAAALVLVLSTGAMVDSMRTTFDVIYGDAERYDLRVDLVRPMPASEVRALASGVPGATRVEELASMPVELRAHGATTNALLRGLRDDAELVRSMDLDRRVVMPEPGGIVLARSTARSLGVGIGDRVHARVLPDGAEADFRVSGLADGVFGDTATVRIDDAARALGLGDRATAAVLRVRAGELDRARSAVAALPEAAHVEDLAGTRQQMSALMGLGWVMIGTMLLFSVILAAAILFNTATLDILERRRELATLRALGRSQREIAIGTTIEHAVLALVGFGVGIPLSIVATKKTLALFSSDLFQLPFVLSPATIGAAGIGIVLVLLLAQWPALRSVARASLADMVRVRS